MSKRLATLAFLACLALAVCGAGARAAGPPSASADLPSTITLDGREVPLHFPPVLTEGGMLVWMRDLEQAGKIRTRWDPKTRAGLIATPTIVLELRVDAREMRVITTLADGAVQTQSLTLPATPVLAGGHLMVPLDPICQAFGISTARPPTPLLAAEDHPDPNAAGSVMGEVGLGGLPLEGVVLRLVHEANAAFLRDRRAVSDARGRYRFPRVPAGRYCVYAYVGDNPAYFNRQTTAVEVKQSATTAPRLAMGWVILPRLPSADARVPAAQPLLLRWGACPSTSEYEVTVLDPETTQPVLQQHVKDPEVTIPADTFAAGHTYHVRIVAHARDGSFLGSTPGTGPPPWSFTAE